VRLKKAFVHGDVTKGGNMLVQENGLRSYLTGLEKDGLFRWVHKVVNKDWEIGDVTRLLFSGVSEQDRLVIMDSPSEEDLKALREDFREVFLSK